jgi:hypothetical protein
MNKPTHPVELLCCAIATQEGWFDANPTVIPRAHNNPGDLVYAGQLNASNPSVGTIADFTSPATGITALFRQVWEYAAMGYTVTQIVETWAPATQNNTTAYLNNVLEWTGLPPNIPILDLLPPLVNLAYTSSS